MRPYEWALCNIIGILYEEETKVQAHTEVRLRQSTRKRQQSKSQERT